MSSLSHLPLILLVHLTLAGGLLAEDKVPAGGEDPFAQIANERPSATAGSFAANPAPKLPEVTLPWDATRGTGFQPLPTISTQAQLDAELARMRTHVAPFMADLAPALPSRPRLELTSFSWRLTPDTDPSAELATALAGKGEWKTVAIPHYAGPVGKAASFYRTEIEVPPALLTRERLFLHFQAVDYLTEVYINGRLAGTHEGIFDAFEFDIRPLVTPGRNVVLLRVRNEGTPVGAMNLTDGSKYAYGTKLAAFGGPGWDDVRTGWICAPPGFGLWQRCWLEARSAVYLNDLYVRTQPDRRTVEVWAELGGLGADQQTAVDLSASCAVYGQNFNAIAAADRPVPITLDPGVIDTFASPQPASAAAPTIPVRRFRFMVALPEAKLWTTDAPWLHQLQVRLSRQGQEIDAGKRQFGVRTFVQSTTSTPKGRFYLNDVEIRLRGANMMGNLQQCVVRRNDAQLVDDLLLAKIAHMNFWRMTQQPCQEEVFDRFDQIGILSQADMPTFAHIPRSKQTEFLRQVGALLRLVRGHACNALISYLNEPIGAKTFRQTGGVERLTVPETAETFQVADALIPQVAPEQVRKWVEGNDLLLYRDPYIDHHSYPLWYGKIGYFRSIYLGAWARTSPGWMFSCGEHGTEGVDTPDLLRKYFPPEWLGTTVDGKWTPAGMPNQASRPAFQRWMRPFTTMEEWCANSREFQRCATRLMVDALRRIPGMNSTALHLLIDAWPASWPKTVIDYERKAKPAYFEFRDAQTPLAVNLRPNRHFGFAGETLAVAVFLCNDTPETLDAAVLRYQVEQGGAIIATGQATARVDASEPRFHGWIRVPVPAVMRRTPLTLRVALFDRTGTQRHDRAVDLEAFPAEDKGKTLEMPGGWWEYLTQKTPPSP